MVLRLLPHYSHKVQHMLNHIKSNQLQQQFTMKRRLELSPLTMLLQDRRITVRMGFGLELFRIVEKLTELLDKSLLISRLLMRTAVLGILFVPVSVSFPFWYYATLRNRPADESPNSIWWLDYLVWSLEVAGPTWIKIGQWASSRSDLFPAWTCQSLSKLQDNVYPHSFSYTRKVVESCFHQKLTDVFVEFSVKPVGIGAVAQVYKARLRGSSEGEYVAVKVLHPNVRDVVNLDLTIMHAVACFLEFVIPDCHWLSLPDEVAIFGGMMRQQMDLNVESRNLSKFAVNFSEWSSVGFPEPKFISTTNQNILIESWIDGIPMQKFLQWNNNRFDRKIAQLGLTSFLKMLVLDNHLHADLHPGNILVTFLSKDGYFLDEAQVGGLSSVKDPLLWAAEMERLAEENYTPFVYYLDAGLTCSLSPQNLTNFIDLFRAIADFDGELISSLMVERSKTPWSVVHFDEFSQSMNAFMKRIRENTFAFKHMDVSDILHFVFSSVRKHHVKIDGAFANIGVAIMLMEGVGQRLDADSDLLKAAVPFLTQAVKLRMKGSVSETEKSFVQYWKARIFGIGI